MARLVPVGIVALGFGLTLSARQVPQTIAPEIQPPAYGHTLYVFELPKQ